MYKIGYIENYSKFNTPRFPNISVQNTFFDSHIDYVFDAYYPPYYTNIIKLTTSDIPFNSRINFLYIIHKQKRYYYFINDINYINEDVFEISIEMDVIQTFLFNIKITDYSLVRESIKRWTSDGYINRDYIPENISQGEFLIDTYEYKDNIDANLAFDWYICWSSKDWAESGEANSQCYIKNEYNMCGTGLYCYLVPMPKMAITSANYQITVGAYTHTYTYYEFQAAFSVMQSLDAAHTIKILKLNNSFVNDIMEISLDNSLPLTTIMTITRKNNNAFVDSKFRYSNSNTNYFALTLFEYNNIYKKNSTYSLKTNDSYFIRNNDEEIPFNYHFCPQLIDENFIQLNFGEKIYSSSPQLRKSKTIFFDLWQHFDINSGYRSYCSTFDNIQGTFIDKYNANVVIPLPYFIAIVNTAWSTYYANHYGSLTTGITQQYTNAMMNFGKNVIGSVNVLSSKSSTVKSENFDITDETMKTTSYASATKSYTKLASSGINVAQDMYNINTNLQVLRENLYNAPATVGQGSEIFTSLSSYDDRTVLAISIVTDIEECARKFEYYGYKVNKTSILNDTLNNISRNRIYWNVYKFTNVNTTISSTNPCMISNDLIGEYKLRLEDGIRFIEYDKFDALDTILSYDNVEL